MRALAALAAAAALAAPANAAESPALAVDASVSPAAVLFGDPVDVTVQVLVDEDRVDPATVRLEADAAPLTRLGRIQRDSWRSGGLAYVRFRFRVACAADGCLAGDAPLLVRPPPMRVSGRDTGGREAGTSVRWPRLEVGRRVRATAVTATPAFAVEDRPHPVSWRLAPGQLSAVLAIAAVLLLAFTAGLVASEVLHARRRRRRRAAMLDALASALADLRAARDVPTRRQAAGRIARILDGLDGRMAPAAARLAWSEERPAPDAAKALAEQVEHEVEP